MPNPKVESAAGELARTDIRLIFDDYRVAQAVRRRRRGRIRVGDLSDRPHQLVVASVVGVVEHLSIDVLIGRGGRENRARDWDGQVKEWSTISVDMTSACPSLPAVRGYYDARTAILHAGGHLTTGQLKEARYAKVLENLAAAGIRVSQHQVLVDGITAQACVDVCLRFVDEVEGLRVA